ncbi:MAG: type I-E CRISPR-associated protein Cas6/Cse3/CasE [Clostridiales bacterium]|nr:type I-E CRISPR-associated protein Cas6/Cse3/CasE [Clostridiales bacterium]
MYYLSRIILDDTNRKVMEGFARPSLFHGAVERSIDGPRKRNIWRIDRFKGKSCLLLVTSEKPDLSSIQKEFGYENVQPEIKEYDAFLQKLSCGQIWRFRIKLNPVVNRDSKRIPIKSSQMKDWFMGKVESYGFTVNSDGFDIVDLRDYDFHKNGESYLKKEPKVRFKTVTFEGILTITDSEKIKSALVTGIGKEKAFGCGLLTLAGL